MPDCYLYHPREIPIHIIPNTLHSPHQTASKQSPELISELSLCRGGLRCDSDVFVPPSTAVSLKVGIEASLDGHDITTTGWVLWCQRLENRYLLSIGFTDPQTIFKIRMIEQACEIECYRRRQKRYGRFLSAEQAAKEWIENHAADFPQLGRLQ